MIRKSMSTMYIIISLIILGVIVFFMIDLNRGYLDTFNDNVVCKNSLKDVQSFDDVKKTLNEKCYGEVLNLEEEQYEKVLSYSNKCFKTFSDIRNFNENVCIKCFEINIENYDYDKFLKSLETQKKVVNSLLSETYVYENLNEKVLDKRFNFEDDIEIYFKIYRENEGELFSQSIDFEKSNNCKNFFQLNYLD